MIILATLLLSLWNPCAMSHDEAVSAGFIPGTDAYYVAITGKPLNLAPIR